MGQEANQAGVRLGAVNPDQVGLKQPSANSAIKEVDDKRKVQIRSSPFCVTWRLNDPQSTGFLMALATTSSLDIMDGDF